MSNTRFQELPDLTEKRTYRTQEERERIERIARELNVPLYFATNVKIRPAETKRKRKDQSN